ncbi:MAG TPA: ABC transporter ATP-binding protein [Alphaproteobacteria bacterium]|jgi:iron(III) transport system ATP-binding protein
MPDVELTGVTKRFGPVTAVDGVDLHARDEEMVTLLGPSGCGKTTTLRMIAGLEVPDAGSIRIGGARMFDAALHLDVPPERRELGMVFQSYAIWPHMTVYENVSYPLRMRRVPAPDARRRVEGVLDLVGLGGYIDAPATNLSGGQQQRVALARALVFEPQVLLLDEPLSNLDAKLREHMRYELRIMQQRLGVTALYVTHDQEEALTLSDRVVVMNQGRIEQSGSPREIYEQPATRFVAEFIGKANFIAVAGRVELGNGGASVPLRTYDGQVTIRLGSGSVRVGANGGAIEGASLFIRPEKISIRARDGVPDGETERIAGRILGRAYLGDHNEYLVGIGDGTDLRVPAPVDEHWAEGAEVDLAIARRDIFLYP